MYRDAYTGVVILIVEFIFEEKRLNEISENKFHLFENNRLYGRTAAIYENTCPLIYLYYKLVRDIFTP